MSCSVGTQQHKKPEIALCTPCRLGTLMAPSRRRSEQAHLATRTSSEKRGCLDLHANIFPKFFLRKKGGGVLRIGECLESPQYGTNTYMRTACTCVDLGSLLKKNKQFCGTIKFPAVANIGCTRGCSRFHVAGSSVSSLCACTCAASSLQSSPANNWRTLRQQAMH